MSAARIIVIGNEVLSGEVQDGNIHYLASELTGLGTRVEAISVIPDIDEVIIETIRAGIRNGCRLLVTGGIGPTHDDRTRGAVALSLEVPLVLHPEAEERLRAGYGPAITPSELSMALLPAGSRLIPGTWSGVFGFAVGPVYVFPGVPHLLQDIFPSVAAEFQSTPDHRVEVVTHHKEGDFADDLTRIQADFPDVAIGSYPHHTAEGWTVRLIFRGQDAGRVKAAAALVRIFLD